MGDIWDELANVTAGLKEVFQELHQYNAELGAENRDKDATIATLQAEIDRLTPKPTPVTRPKGASVDWNLKWSDLAQLADHTGYPWGPNWSTNEGNKEDQAYLPENVVHPHKEDPLLHLVAIKEISPVPKTINGGKLKDGRASLPFTSGAVNTKGIAEARYGWWEADVTMPAGSGLWPAVWLVPVEGDAPPEIDIAEVLGHQPNVLKVNAHKKSVVPGKYSTQMGPISIMLPRPVTERHTYGVEIRPAGLFLYVDGQLAASAGPDYLPDRPMYMLLNLAVNGKWPRDAGALVNEQTQFPATMTIHGVRLWEAK